jgi:DNA repair protein RecN (Recombination protein N)
VNERLSTIYRLLKKHRAGTVNELLALRQNLQQRFDLTTNLDEELTRSEKAFRQSETEVLSLAGKLTETRKKAFEPLRKQLVKLLKDLGIPDAALAMDIQSIAPMSTGVDKVEILFSANKGIAPKPLAMVASGGEFSRLMFCIKYVLAEKTSLPTLVLDEIDNGVSGEIAMKLGDMMKAMSRAHQLITITHLPQIAARGEVHYFVYKNSASKKTVSQIRQLSKDERVEEIAKMIGGAKPSKIALENAQELLMQ